MHNIGLQHGQRGIKQKSQGQRTFWQTDSACLERARLHQENKTNSLQGCYSDIVAAWLLEMDSLSTTGEDAWPVPSPLPAEGHGILMAGQNIQHRSAETGLGLLRLSR